MSALDSLCTPRWLTAQIPWVQLDPCSNAHSTVRATRAIALPDDGLAEPWGKQTVFCNPPYSGVAPWADAAVACAEAGGEVLMLVNLDPTTRWWSIMMRAPRSTVLLFRDRIAFEGEPAKGGPGVRPSAFVLLHRDERTVFDGWIQKLRMRGVVW